MNKLKLHAKSFVCPKCGAQPWTRCQTTSRIGGQTNRKYHTARIHKARKGIPDAIT